MRRLRPARGGRRWLAGCSAAILTIAIVATALFAGLAVAASRATPPSNATLPTISGAADEGATLTASNGTWKGDPPTSYSYQWRLCDALGASCDDIGGATAQTYVVTTDEIGGTLRVYVTATNAAGSAAALSDQTAQIGDSSTLANSAKPVLSGSAVVGQTLTTTSGTWMGDPAPTFTYGWEWCDATGAQCTTIAGATSSTLTVDSTKLGDTIRSVVTADNGDSTVVAESEASAPVTTSSGPRTSGQPAIVGTLRVGRTVTAQTGTWSGTAPIAFSFAWQRCNAQGAVCSTIAGATRQTYVVAAADNGLRLRALITARNVDGTGTVLTTPTAPVGTTAATAPQPVAPQTGDRALLPDGRYSVPVTAVAAPDRLVVSTVRFRPARVTTRARIETTIRVTDSRGDVVRGVLVDVAASPRGAVGRLPGETTDLGGYATVLLRPTAKLRLRRGTLVLVVRAHAPAATGAPRPARRVVKLPVRP